MSSSGFPQLLRQTNFASFDPSISRVYTSTRSSVHKHGDWGLKKPIYRSKGPRYIRVTKLDAGRLLGSDWRSGEQEARFIKAYGDGRVQWTDRDDHYQNLPLEQSLWNDDEFKAPEPKKNVDLMADVNNMTESEFAKYIKEVKLYRSRYLEGKLNHLREETISKLALPEDRTMLNLSVQGHVNNKDISNFQAGLTMNDLGKKGNKTIISTPHEVHGIAYSKISSSAANVNPLLYHQGRALDRPDDNRSPRAKAIRPNALALNRNWVVSLGGIGALSNVVPGRMSSAHTHLLREGVDFERKDRSRGSGFFKISKAQISEPPRVVGLDGSSDRRIYNRHGPPKAVTPLNTFKFDVKVDVVGDEVPEMVRELGSRDWVSGKGEPETTYDESDSWRDDIFGGRRGRDAGASSREYERFQAKRDDESRSTLSDLIPKALDRINEKKQQQQTTKRKE